MLRIDAEFQERAGRDIAMLRLVVGSLLKEVLPEVISKVDAAPLVHGVAIGHGIDPSLRRLRTHTLLIQPHVQVWMLGVERRVQQENASMWPGEGLEASGPLCSPSP